jgi:Flp pilus assembly protein TadG
MRSWQGSHKGAAAVEFALIAPLLFLLMLGMVELGRAVMVMQIVTNAAREGARFAVIDGPASSPTTAAVVQNYVATYLTSAGLPSSAATILVDPEPSSATDGTQVTVTVSIPYSAVSWIPATRFMTGRTLSARVIMCRQTLQ